MVRGYIRTMTDRYPSDYPAYARSERIADAVVQGAGLVLALTGSVLLIVFAALWLGAGQVAALSVYGAAMVFSFAASAFYHFTPWEVARPVLRRVDHAAIYLKIAGTVTPFVVILGTGLGYAGLALIWTLAVAGATAKLFFWRAPGLGNALLYLGLGWIAGLLIWPLLPVLPGWSTALIVAGGLLYSAGVIFFRWDGLKYALAIWHGFVVAASGCFFAAIALGVFGTAA